MLPILDTFMLRYVIVITTDPQTWLIEFGLAAYGEVSTPETCPCGSAVNLNT